MATYHLVRCVKMYKEEWNHYGDDYDVINYLKIAPGVISTFDLDDKAANEINSTLENDGFVLVPEIMPEDKTKVIEQINQRINKKIEQIKRQRKQAEEYTRLEAERLAKKNAANEKLRQKLQGKVSEDVLNNLSIAQIKRLVKQLCV